MQADPHVADIAHIIQLAVAPVFLLSGVGVTLTVLTNRLSRIVDRARVLEERLVAALEPAKAGLHADLHTLARRARFINWSITLTTSCGLLVCLVIMALFVGYFLRLDLSESIAVLFIVAMLAFVVAFVSFLREIFLATGSLRIGPY
ncbi:DUF2721 domain-containing protein [Sulfuricaulis sp.]|uniref:DUF2721 domain-containing protein n=1 Tax=Sulfuricaulis sp. TaxID=2003553 RepID=UPI00355A4150